MFRSIEIMVFSLKLIESVANAVVHLPVEQSSQKIVLLKFQKFECNWEVSMGNKHFRTKVNFDYERMFSSSFFLFAIQKTN